MLVIEIAQGLHLCLPAQLSKISTYVFLEQENWFEDESDFVARLAEPGGRMLDIGSSFGFYSLSYAAAAGPGSRIWAFEPTPAVCQLLRESIRLNRLEQITLLETAVGAENGRCKFVSEESSELNSIDAARMNSRPRTASATSTTLSSMSKAMRPRSSKVAGRSSPSSRPS